MNFSFGRRQRQGLIVFLLVSLLFPIMLATLLVGIGNASGCQMVGQTAKICLVMGIDVGQAIKTLVDWTWYMPVLSAFQVPILSIGLFIGLLVLVYKSLQGWTRALVGFFSIWYMCFAPSIAATILVAYLAGQAQCPLNEGGVGACYLFGRDMGSTFHTAAALPWLLIILFPLCSIVSAIYIVIALVNRQQRTPE